MSPFEGLSALETLSGGSTGPVMSGPATQGGSSFKGGGLTINKPNYAMWGAIALAMVLLYLWKK